MRLQGVIESPDAVSNELFGGALRLADRRGLVSAAGVSTRREAFQREIGTVVDRVVRIGEYEKAAITETIHG